VGLGGFVRDRSCDQDLWHKPAPTDPLNAHFQISDNHHNPKQYRTAVSTSHILSEDNFPAGSVGNRLGSKDLI
jgi:hypothetical protein